MELQENQEMEAFRQKCDQRAITIPDVQQPEAIPQFYRSEIANSECFPGNHMHQVYITMEGERIIASLHPIGVPAILLPDSEPGQRNEGLLPSENNDFFQTLTKMLNL